MKKIAIDFFTFFDYSTLRRNLSEIWLQSNVVIKTFAGLVLFYKADISMWITPNYLGGSILRWTILDQTMEKGLNSLGMVQMLGILQLWLLETVQLQMVDLWLEDTTQTGTTGTQAYKLMSYSYLTMFWTQRTFSICTSQFK